MTVFHFRESRGGTFFHEQGRWAPLQPDGMPVLRFALAQGGVAVDRWETAETSTWAILGGAGLDWRVDVREVFTRAADGRTIPIGGHRALVRPDTGHPMSVVGRSYRHAENGWVAETAVAVARSHDRTACLVAAVGFGKEGERTLFAVRVTGGPETVLVLLAHNTHGGEGAVRFRLVEVECGTGAVLSPDVSSAVETVAHLGDIEANLSSLVRREMIQKYVAETSEIWEGLAEALWTPRHTTAVISELWPQAERYVQTTPDNTTLHHPRGHLTEKLAGCTDAATAYKTICRYMDNDSEARERGDYTKDRDERLALGAGLRHKQRAWTWIVGNT